MLAAEVVDERLLAASKVMDGLARQFEAASSQPERDALHEHHRDAENRFNHEVERLIDENRLQPIVEKIAAAVLTDDADQAL